MYVPCFASGCHHTQLPSGCSWSFYADVLASAGVLIPHVQIHSGDTMLWQSQSEQLAVHSVMCATAVTTSTLHPGFTLQVAKTYSGPREALQLTGKFVLAHLLEAAKAGPDLSCSPFVLGLHQQVTTSHALWKATMGSHSV